MHYLHKAFTLLEVVIVITILGIVASIGSTVLAQLYENHITQRAMHRASLKTELAINQITNRLAYRIDNTVIARRGDNTFNPLIDMIYTTTNTDRAVLEWIGYDEESFSAHTIPGWSGYCDVNATSTSGRIVTPGSRLNALTNTIVQNLSGSTATPTLGLLFSLGGQLDGGNFQVPACFGYNDDGNTSCIHQVTIRDNTTLNTDRLAGAANTTISDQYKLAWSAYAIVAVNQDALYTDTRNNAVVAPGTPDSFDLNLCYGYQPWSGTQYFETNNCSTLVRNVTSFKYSEQGGTMRIKLCATERVGDLNTSTNISVCKEKVVMR